MVSTSRPNVFVQLHQALGFKKGYNFLLCEFFGSHNARYSRHSSYSIYDRVYIRVWPQCFVLCAEALTVDYLAVEQ
jgi:hypothetical protein